MTSTNGPERFNAKNYDELLPYRMEAIHSALIDTTTYQRPLDMNKVKRIAAEFNERIANEPKVSLRDGRYYVFDGQHTIAARKLLNDGNDLVIVCKVFYGMTQEEEALLFAAQTGVSSKPTSGVTFMAKKIGNDARVLSFIKVNEEMNIQPSYSDVRGKYRLRCINTAHKEFDRVGEMRYREAMKIIVGAWKGKSSSLISDVIVAVCRFVNIYFGEYDRQKLIRRLSCSDPYDIVKASRSLGEDGGKKRALKLILNIYNDGNDHDLLPVRF